MRRQTVESTEEEAMTPRELGERVAETRRKLEGPPGRVGPEVLENLAALADAAIKKDSARFTSSLVEVDSGMRAEGEIVLRCADVWDRHQEDCLRVFGSAAKQALGTLGSVPAHPAAAKDASNLANTLGKHRIDLRRAQSNYADLSGVAVLCHDFIAATHGAGAAGDPSVGPGGAPPSISALKLFWEMMTFVLLPIARQPCCIKHQTTALSLLAKAAEPEVAALCDQAFAATPNHVYQHIINKLALEEYPMVPAEFARYGTAKKLKESLVKTRFHRALRYVAEALRP